jgi:GNAT superfamily N-acetyltransferase
MAALDMYIDSLANRSELAEVIGKWHWNEWGYADPEGSVESWTVGIASRNNLDSIPMTYVALSEVDVLLGSVTLVDCDMDTHPELSPWLAGLYVDSSARRSGVGRALTKHAFDSALSMGIDRLYLYTSKAKSLYLSLGWSVIGNEYYEGEAVTIMCKSNI